MSAAISITRLDMTASELRNFAGKCGDGAQVRRLLAIALVLEHCSRAEAAELNGMDRQTLSDWVHRSNAAGIDGLKSGLPPWRRAAAERGTAGGIEGACRRRSGSGEEQVIRWRCVDSLTSSVKGMGLQTPPGGFAPWTPSKGPLTLAGIQGGAAPWSGSRAKPRA
jgi:hypothetical protein